MMTPPTPPSTCNPRPPQSPHERTNRHHPATTPLDRYHRRTHSEKTHHLRALQKTQSETKTKRETVKVSLFHLFFPRRTTFWVKTKTHLNSPARSRLASLSDSPSSLRFCRIYLKTEFITELTGFVTFCRIRLLQATPPYYSVLHSDTGHRNLRCIHRMGKTAYKRLLGSQNFRQRLLLATLSSTPILIEDIRADETWPGLRDHEISLLRLFETVCDDCHVEINETGISFQFHFFL